MSDVRREFNMKKFLRVLPANHPPTFWAQYPGNVPARIRRAADTYEEIAREAESKKLSTAKTWRSIADILAEAATRAEAVAAMGETA